MPVGFTLVVGNIVSEYMRCVLAYNEQFPAVELCQPVTDEQYPVTFQNKGDLAFFVIVDGIIEVLKIPHLGSHGFFFQSWNLEIYGFYLLGGFLDGRYFMLHSFNHARLDGTGDKGNRKPIAR